MKITKKQEHLLAYLIGNMDRCEKRHTWPSQRDLNDLEDAGLILPDWQYGVKITEAGLKYLDQGGAERTEKEIRTYVVKLYPHWFNLMEYPAGTNTVNEDYVDIECFGVSLDDPMSMSDYLRSSGAVDQPCNIIFREVKE